jgi:hypothetical protein
MSPVNKRSVRSEKNSNIFLGNLFSVIFFWEKYDSSKLDTSTFNFYVDILFWTTWSESNIQNEE